MTLKDIKIRAIDIGLTSNLTLAVMGLIDLAYEAGRLEGATKALDNAKKIVAEVLDREVVADG